MRTGLNLKPGDKGTKRLVAEYGERLLCVRYRYDKERGKRLKTVELIVEEVDWQPVTRLKAETVVGVRGALGRGGAGKSSETGRWKMESGEAAMGAAL